jgi:hypothetical protein
MGLSGIISGNKGYFGFSASTREQYQYWSLERFAIGVPCAASVLAVVICCAAVIFARTRSV